MSLEGEGRTVAKARHPLLTAIAVVAIVVVAATAYTFIGSLPPPSDERASAGAEPASAGGSTTEPAGRDR